MSKQDIDAILKRHNSNLGQVHAAFAKAGGDFHASATDAVWQFFETMAKNNIVIAAEYETDEPKVKKERKPRTKKSGENSPPVSAD